MRVYVATKNAGKLRELRDMFSHAGIDVRTFEGYADVEEGDDSYADNAALKARTLREQLMRNGTTEAVLGDDSGLEVRALGNRPGVLSARYAGVDATWSQRRRAFLSELAVTANEDRAARFVCALHFIAVDGTESPIFATFDGAITADERGDAGFSYDPIFEIPARGKTFAEIDTAEKNRISHRAIAARALLERLGLPVAEPESSAATGNQPSSGM